MLFIIIPVHNRLHYTIECLLSLRKQTFPNFKIIVVDDGSTDGTSEYLKEYFPEVTILMGDGKLWWTGATNLGIKYALKKSFSDADLFLTLNNDLIVNPNYLEALIQSHNNNKDALIGSISINIENENEVVYAGIKWNEYTASYKPAINIKETYFDIKRKHEYINSDFLSGRGTLIPKRVLVDIGLFDYTNFPQYVADEDFSLRSRKKGYKCLISVNAIVYSHIKATGASSLYFRLTFKEFFKSLNSIKSPNHLKKKWIWAQKHTRYPYLYFMLSVSRMTGSFLKTYLKMK